MAKMLGMDAQHEAVARFMAGRGPLAAQLIAKLDRLVATFISSLA
jgi:hypothetical protein